MTDGPKTYHSGGIVSEKDVLAWRHPAPHAAPPLAPTSPTFVVTIGPEPECPTALLREILPMLERLGRHGGTMARRVRAVLQATEARKE